jgi:hypothetical protein
MIYDTSQADLNPKSFQSRYCDHLARLALDAAKAPEDLGTHASGGAQWGQKPHYLWENGVKPGYGGRRSVSVVGRAYDLVQAGIKALSPTCALLDEDLDADLYQVST